MLVTPTALRGIDLLEGGNPDAAALLPPGAPGRALTYGELRARVAGRQDELALAARSLVVVEASNTAEFVVTYLALLGAGHVPLLAGRHATRLADRWGADALVATAPGGIEIDRRGDGGRHRLHPELALLLSTSGSTGAAKLVRLSGANLLSNAAAIADYLGLTAADRAITSLPLHYCYGLSVLHSHLAAGASVVLTEATVVDPCFASAMADHGVTSLAGVPYTFELLERVGPDAVNVPSLRAITQAGGRLHPERVRAWSERARAWGVEFYVMYGQTEATARMAYLPPHLATRHPEAIGVPIPGGRFELRPVAGATGAQGGDVGELVYHGPNVMLGYADEPADLARGSDVEALATGDLARFHATPDGPGVYEIVGRANRFIKPFGVRVDLDAIEAELAGIGIVEAAASGDDERVVVAVADALAPRVRDHVVTFTGLPSGAVAAVEVGALPRTASGKPDYEAVRGLAPPPATPQGDDGSVTAVYRSVLGRDDVTPASTFVSLGGDSLSYVECSLRLERVCGRLPSDWHLLPVAVLEGAGPRRRLPTLDTSVVLRALGICLIVSTHMRLWWFPGGAHVLLAIVGYNFSRFQLPLVRARDRLRAGWRAIVRVGAPTAAFTVISMALVGKYGWPTAALVNNLVGPRHHVNGRWHYWFVEVFVHLILVMTVLLAIPPLRRVERRRPYLFALGIFAALLLFRYRVVELGEPNNLRFTTVGTAWFFALGWLAHCSTTSKLRMLTTVLCATTVPGFFGRPEREWFIVAGIVALLWIRHVPMPVAGGRLVSLIAASSLWILITHFRVWPVMERNLPLGAAFVATLAVGAGAWWLYESLLRPLRRLSTRPPAMSERSERIIDTAVARGWGSSDPARTGAARRHRARRGRHRPRWPHLRGR